MESKTLSKIHAVLTQELMDAESGTDGLCYSFLIKLEQTEEWAKSLSFIFSQNMQLPFSITLDLQGFSGSFSSTEWQDQLLLILSHPQMLHINGKPMICFIHSNPEDKGGTRLVETTISKHNIAQPVWIDLGKPSAVSGNLISYSYYHPLANQQQFNEWYYEQLFNTDGLLHIFADFNKKELGLLQKFRHVAEEFLKETNFRQYALISKLQAKSEKVHEYQQLVGMLTEDLQSKKDYLDFLLGKFKEGGQVSNVDFNQIIKLKQWYYREYEVLPLWYKRFGHIIKVLTGKRTLKSLFSDDAPKY